MVNLFPHPASFRFRLTTDTLAFGYLLPATGRIRVFHPLETCAAGRTHMKRKTHPYGQVFLFMESGNVLLSQVFPHVLDPPPAAHTGEPNQVQCWTLA